MKVMIAYPPLPRDKGVALLSQNRQFQYFHNPTYIYPMIPAYAATLLKSRGHEVVWADGIAEGWTPEQFRDHIRREKPDMVAVEVKTPVVKAYWRWIDELKAGWNGHVPLTVLMGDHVTALPEESFENSRVDYASPGGDFDFGLLNLASHLSGGEALEGAVLPEQRGCGLQHRAVQGPHAPRASAHRPGSYEVAPLCPRQRELQASARDVYDGRPRLLVAEGRGCTFCSWTTTFPKFRVRSPESLLDEIGILIERYGVREVFDDTGTFPWGGGSGTSAKA